MHPFQRDRASKEKHSCCVRRGDKALAALTLTQKEERMNIQVHPSPIGPLTLVSEGQRLVGCYFANSSTAKKLQRKTHPNTNDPILNQARDQLDRFFSRKLQAFSVPMAPRGTEFQVRVWRALQSIPYGKTASYGAIAGRIGRPTAARAVGTANGRNPICIFVPCHRVVGSDGSLTGFGGGLERKEFLLALES